MGLASLEILIGFTVGLYLLYRYLNKNFNHWQKRNVKGPKPKLFYGTSKDFFKKQFYATDNIKEIYDMYPDEPAVGLFARTRPVLMIKNPDMIKNVLVKNFTSFANRGFKFYFDLEPIFENLFLVKYPVWKPLRRKMAPVFTSGKLKDMFYLIRECTEHFVEYLNEIVDKNQDIECQELAAKFTTDVIGVCAFGLNMNALSNENSEFRKIGRDLSADTWSNRLLFVSRMMPHWIARFLTPLVRNDKAHNFFINTLRDTMEFRKKNNVRQNDFVDLLMDIRDHPEDIGEEKMSEVFIAAQAFVFFIGGFETTSSAISNTMYELALNPNVQDKLRAEVIEAFDMEGGKFTYDSIKNITYLEKVLKETLRKYPPLTFLSREITKDYIFEKFNISVGKGTPIIIPTHAIHHDPQIYPDPEKYDPERFNEDVENTRPHMSYLPFGDGPRMCIGERFAYNQTKMGLAAIIKNFKFEVCDKTPKIYKKRPNGTILASVDGLHLKIRKINSC